MNYCIDCGKEISRGSRPRRCRPCSFKARRGIRFSEEHKTKISKALKGRKQSPEHKSKCVGNLKIGWTRAHPPISEETRRKLSEAAKRREKAHIEALHSSNLANGHYCQLGETRIDRKGYVMVKVQHYARNRNWRHLHRVVMEQYLGRKLERKETVHHIDGNKTNNDINNLAILTCAEHGVLSNVLNTSNKNLNFPRIVIETLRKRYSLD